VSDARGKRDGKFIENIGSYDPGKHPHELKIKDTRVFHWLRNGAQPTDTVRSLLKREGIWLRWTLQRQKKKKDDAAVEAIMDRWKTSVAGRIEREKERRERRRTKKKQAAQSAAGQESAS